MGSCDMAILGKENHNCTPVLLTSCHRHFNLCRFFEGRSMSLISIPGTKHTHSLYVVSTQSRRDRRMEVWESWTREKEEIKFTQNSISLVH